MVCNVCVTGIAEEIIDKDYSLVPLETVKTELFEYKNAPGYKTISGTEVFLWRMINNMLSDCLLINMYYEFKNNGKELLEKNY